MKKLTQEAKTAIYEYKYGIMMSELCALLFTSPDRIKAMSTDIATGLTDPRLMQNDVLEIISRHTNIPINELTISPDEPVSKEHERYEYYEQPTGKWWPCSMNISAYNMQGIEIRLKDTLNKSIEK